MRFLVPLLVLSGLLAIATGFLQMALKQGEECSQEFNCEGFASLENALAGATFFCIGAILWGIAGTLSWMRKRFDKLAI